MNDGTHRHCNASSLCWSICLNSGIHRDEYHVSGSHYFFLSTYSLILTSPFQRLTWSWLEISNIQPRQLERIPVWCLSLLQKIRCLKVYNCYYIILLIKVQNMKSENINIVVSCFGLLFMINVPDIIKPLLSLAVNFDARCCICTVCIKHVWIVNLI